MNRTTWGIIMLVVMVLAFLAGYHWPFFTPEIEILSREISSGFTAVFGSIFVLSGVERLLF